MIVADCKWTEIDGRWTCPVCEIPRQKPWSGDGAPPPRNCRASMVGPAFYERAINFAKAVFTQTPLVAEAVLTGDESKAFRSAEEIERIAAICKPCPLFNGDICTHAKCGCNIDAKRAAWWNKLAWKSQQCPDNPPRWM